MTLPAPPAITRYRHVLVPLDGSEAAEKALPDAVSAAVANGAGLTLLHVIPPALAEIYAGAEIIAIDQQEGARRDAAHGYLASVRQKLESTGVAVQTAVAVGDAADAILTYADQHGVDLVVIATHGRSGWKRWVLGSVAEKVVRAANQPVLLVRLQQPSGATR